MRGDTEGSLGKLEEFPLKLSLAGAGLSFDVLTAVCLAPRAEPGPQHCGTKIMEGGQVLCERGR